MRESKEQSLSAQRYEMRENERSHNYVGKH